MVDLTGPLEGLIYERRNHIAYITLDRPDRGNALHASQVEPIKAIWKEVREDPWIRCAIVTATGDRHFCTGADVGAVASRGGVAAGQGTLAEEVHWSPRQNSVGGVERSTSRTNPGRGISRGTLRRNGGHAPKEAPATRRTGRGPGAERR